MLSFFIFSLNLNLFLYRFKLSGKFAVPNQKYNNAVPAKKKNYSTGMVKMN